MSVHWPHPFLSLPGSAHLSIYYNHAMPNAAAKTDSTSYNICKEKVFLSITLTHGKQSTLEMVKEMIRPLHEKDNEEDAIAKAFVNVNEIQFKIPIYTKVTSTGPNSRVEYKEPKQIVEHVRVILTGRETLDVKHPWHILLNKDKDSLRLASIAQEKQLGHLIVNGRNQ